MIVTVIYPNHEGARFDVAYYIDSHARLLREVWAPVKVTLVRGLVAPGGGATPFAMIGHFEFANSAALDAAMADPRRPELAADVANFTDIKPVLMIGKAV